MQDLISMPNGYLSVEASDGYPITDPPSDGAKRQVQYEQEGTRTTREFGLRNVTSNLEPE